MIKIYLLLLFLAVFVASTFPQVTPGARQIALGNSDIAISNDVFSIFYNPAGSAQIKHREVGIFYSPSPFGFTELSNGFIAYSEPFSFGSISAGGMVYGFDLYKEARFTGGFSYNYLDRFYGGISFNYHTVSIERYGNASAFYFNAGGVIKFLDELNGGFSIANLNRGSFGDTKDQIPVLFSAGLAYLLTGDFTLTAAFEKDIRYNASLRGGIEYSIIEYLTLRGGFANEPSIFSAGIGINYSYFSFDYALFNHQYLGLTHQAGMIIRFEK
jgi:hypothetical protein